MSPSSSPLAQIDQRPGPLTTRDLWSDEAYCAARPALTRELIELKAARRVRVGDQCSLVFESRASVWFQVQEELRFPGPPWATRASELLERYACLVPRGGDLRASLFLECCEPGLSRELSTTLARCLSTLSIDLPSGRYRASPLELPCDEIQGVVFLRFARCPDAAAARLPTLRWPVPGYAVLSTLPVALARILERQARASSS